LSAPRRLRAVFRLLWVAVCALAIGGLAAELWLQIERRAAERAAGRFAGRNVFDVAALSEGRGETLWEVPGESYRPGARLELEVAGERYAIAINSHGFRDREVSLRKPEGVYRVICVGGSTTVQGRTNAETWPALLQQRLDPLPDGRRVEVLNLGINGTGTDFWLARRERLERLYAFEPDLVVQYAFVNDLFWKELPRYARRHPWRAELGRSLLLSRLRPLPVGELERHLGRTLIRLREMSEAARARGVAYLAGSFAGPDPERASPGFRRYLDSNTELWGASLRLRYYRDYHGLLRRYQALFDAFAARGEVATARVHPGIEDPALYVDLCHMTPEGIAALAQAFAAPVLRLATEGAGGPAASAPPAPVAAAPN
jgi:lysophospholipase L1-like esterase